MPLSSERVNILCTGYIQKNSVRSVPYVLQRLILLFYDEYFRWKIKKGKEMKNFLNAKNKEAIYCKSTVTIKDIIFKFCVCPNGWNKEEVGKCLFFIESQSFPLNIEYAIIYIEIIEERTNTKIKRMRKWKNIADTTGWGVYRKDVLMLDELKEFDYLIFSCLISIQSIKYKKKGSENIVMKKKMSKLFKLNWSINKSLIRSFEGIRSGKCLWSPNFDDGHWCIELYPNGNNKSKKTLISLNCLNLPFGAKSVTVNIKAHSKGIKFGDSPVIVSTFSYSRSCDYHIIPNQGFVENYRDLDELRVEIEVEITSIRDEKDKDVTNQAKWTEFGVE